MPGYVNGIPHATSTDRIDLWPTTSRNLAQWVDENVPRNDDPRLSGARPPTAHTHDLGDVDGLETELSDLDARIGAATTAYEVAVQNGFEGTVQEWLASLQGERGPEGPYGGTEVTDPQVASWVADSSTGTRTALDTTYVPQRPASGILASGLALASIRPCPIVFVGSSTTRGANATRPGNRYPSLVTRALQAVFPSGDAESDPVDAWGNVAPVTNPGVHGYNAGIGSTFSHNYLTETVMANITAIKPLAVIHGIGGNDYAYNTDPAAFKANIRAGINAIDTSVGKPVLHVFMHQQRIAGNFTYQWRDYAAALRELAAEAPESRMVVDVSEFFESVQVPGADPFDLGSADNVHLNDNGYRMLAELILREIAGGVHVPPIPEPVRLTSDTFTGGDTPTLAGRSTDAALGGSVQPWQTDTAERVGITGGHLVPGGTFGSGFIAVASAPVVRVGVRVVTKPPGEFAQNVGLWLIARRDSLAGSTNQVRAGIFADGVALGEVHNGTIRYGSLSGYNAGDHIQITSDGRTVSLAINGTEIVSRTVAAGAEIPGGLAGIAFSGVGAESTPWALDDFTVDQL